MKILLFSKRHKLAKMFESWCKINNVDNKSITNVITWLHMNNLLDTDKVEEFISDPKIKE